MTKDKVEMCESWQKGDVTDEEARKFFGEEWEGVKQLSDIQDIIEDQPDPDTDPDDLFKN